MLGQEISILLKRSLCLCIPCLARRTDLYEQCRRTCPLGLSHDATKTSAIEIGKAHDVSKGIDHGTRRKPANDIGAAFSL